MNKLRKQMRSETGTYSRAQYFYEPVYDAVKFFKDIVHLIGKCIS